MWFWSGYQRFIRICSSNVRLWIRRAHCPGCGKTPSLIPSFMLQRRLDPVATIGRVLTAVAEQTSGVRPIADRLGIAHTTAREWVRRFNSRAGVWSAGFSALAFYCGAEAPQPVGSAGQQALKAITLVLAVANPGHGAEQLWPFTSLVTGGGLLATNTTSPCLLLGRRRFIAPVPDQPG